MRTIIAIAKRDYKGFFAVPAGWIAACVIFMVSGFVFYIVTDNLLMRGQSVDPISEILLSIINFINYINIFIIPIFTMKAISEETGSGIYRIYSGAPISTWEIVLGKFFGIISYFKTIYLFVLIYPLYVFIFAQPDLKVLLSGWMGLVFNITALISLGLFVSSLTKNAVISYLASTFAMIVLLFSAFLPNAPEWYRSSVDFLSLGNDFARGVIKTKSLVSYIGVSCLFLFLTRMVLEVKKWKV